MPAMSETVAPLARCRVERTDAKLADGVAYAGFQGILSVHLIAEVSHHQVGGPQRDGKQGGHISAQSHEPAGDRAYCSIPADDDGGADRAADRHSGVSDLPGGIEGRLNRVSISA